MPADQQTLHTFHEKSFLSSLSGRLGLRTCVEIIHRPVRTNGAEIADPFYHPLGQSRHFGLLFISQASEHEINLPAIAEIVADAHAYAGVLARAYALLNVLESVVAAITAVLAHPQRAERYVEIVADDDEILNRDAQLLKPETHRIATEVHIGGRFQQIQLATLP